MKDFIVRIIVILIFLVIILVVSTLAYWGLGKLVIWAFKIDYEWTIWHGLVTGLVITTIEGLLRGTNDN